MTSQDPRPVYHIHQEQPGAAKKVAVGTIVVVVTLVILFCVLPLVLCFGLGFLGMVMDPGSTPTAP